MKKLDRSGMLKLLLDFPDQCRYAYAIAYEAKITFAKRNFKNIIFSGLGGSAIGADLVKSYLYFESRVPIAVAREYELPAYMDDSTLAFISSYSGNTEETLSAYSQAKAKGTHIIVFSSGGKLKEYASRDNITFIEMPKGLPPRAALGYSSLVPLCILARMGLIGNIDACVNETIKTLEDLRDKSLKNTIGVQDNIAKYFAQKLYNKLAFIYSSSVHFDAVATRFRGQLNENSKALALTHVFPEMNHNEIVGWENPKKLFSSFVVIMLRDKFMHPRVAMRMDITKEMIQKNGVSVFEIWSRGRDLLSRMFSLIYIGDFISFYLAILYGIDPTPVDKVNYLKRKLGQA
ncbi:MAG: bifunctional phosphoglucose/phosphomannose isomerase [Candidatus Omnitrophica bacterium]|nr:bifunctional phosphoglucose/phosphomannose isomerase [Candidatus Omnitrophota bacterium]